MPNTDEVIAVKISDRNRALVMVVSGRESPETVYRTIFGLNPIPAPAVPAVAPISFRRGDRLRTTQEMRGSGETMLVGCEAIYVGLNDEREGYIDVVWLDVGIQDNGRRWKGDRFVKIG